MPTLKLEITGPDAKGIAAELAALGAEPTEPDYGALLRSDGDRAIETAVAVAIVVSLPAAVRETLDLVERLRKWARTRSAARAQVTSEGKELDAALDEVEARAKALGEGAPEGGARC